MSTDDLIARLRKRMMLSDLQSGLQPDYLCRDAADEIERLRAALRTIDNVIPKDDVSIPYFLVIAGDVAEAALNGTWPAFGIMPRAALSTEAKAQGGDAG